MEYHISSYAAQDDEAVKSMLISAELPVTDLSPGKLKHFQVARTNKGELAGVIGLEPYGDVGLLRSLAVDMEKRSGGLGRELVNSLEQYAKGLGIRRLYLLTTTAADYFPKLEYQLIKRTEVPEVIAATEEFCSICPASAVCMCKKL